MVNQNFHSTIIKFIKKHLMRQSCRKNLSFKTRLYVDKVDTCFSFGRKCRIMILTWLVRLRGNSLCDSLLWQTWHLKHGREIILVVRVVLEFSLDLFDMFFSFKYTVARAALRWFPNSKMTLATNFFFSTHATPKGERFPLFRSSSPFPLLGLYQPLYLKPTPLRRMRW